MKNILLTLLITFVSFSSKSQDTFFEILENDSLKIFYNGFGKVNINNPYHYYRIGKLNKYIFGYEGKVTDYDSLGNILFKGNYKNGVLNGKATLYYKNGKVNAEGYYKNNKRDSIWVIYYENGKTNLKLKYGENTQLLELYTKKGKILVTNGNGICKLSAFARDIKGEIRNGLRVGTWKHDYFIEEYDEHGNLVEGVELHKSTKYYKTHVPYFAPFLHENSGIFSSLNMIENFQDFKQLNSNLLYNGSENINESFFISLIDSINIYTETENIKYYWFLFETEISNEGNMSIRKEISTNTNVLFNKKVNSWITNNGTWDIVGDDNADNVNYIFYFPIFIFKGQALIPEMETFNLNKLFNL